MYYRIEIIISDSDFSFRFLIQIDVFKFVFSRVNQCSAVQCSAVQYIFSVTAVESEVEMRNSLHGPENSQSLL